MKIKIILFCISMVLLLAYILYPINILANNKTTSEDPRILKTNQCILMYHKDALKLDFTFDVTCAYNECRVCKK